MLPLITLDYGKGKWLPAQDAKQMTKCSRQGSRPRFSGLFDPVLLNILFLLALA